MSHAKYSPPLSVHVPARWCFDVQLVTMVAHYDEVALAELYRCHGGAVFGLARRVINNHTEVEDGTQDILQLWNQPERFDPARGTLRSFLLTQTHSRAVDVILALNYSRRRELNDAARTASAGYATHAPGALPSGD